MKDLSEIIASHPFFSGLDSAYIELITGCARNVKFSAGDVIAREGDPSAEFYVLRHGRVAVEINAPARAPLVLRTASEGEVVGWSWIFPPHRWQFDITALTLVRALAFDGKCLRGKCDADPKLGYDMMRRFAQVAASQLQATRLQLLDLYGGRG